MELKNRTIIQQQKEVAETNQHHKNQIIKLEKQFEEIKQRFTEELLTKDSELSTLEKGVNKQDELRVS